ncbi:deoxyribonuclease-1-like isoform X2 [Babylonia areolata]|uniref:deoxyribonuclease-1-like isoform X2 n=1 Tax=Babylonia areolata TaxID=304850 RepID=UPI003FD5D396
MSGTRVEVVDDCTIEDTMLRSLAVRVVVCGVLANLALRAGYGEAAAVPRATRIRVGAFNIRTFGRSKMSHAVVAGRIKEIVERYDVLLIQEIRDQSVDSVRQLLGMLEQPFDFVISEPIGRSSYKEQYAYFYRTDRMLLLGAYKYEDPSDVFEREPFVAKFAPKSAHNDMISLIGFHAKPSDATAEIGHLRDVISRTLEKMGQNSEPVVLGDLNADCSYADLGDRETANDYLTVNNGTYTWLIGEDADTTVRSSTDCAYDRIVVRSSLEDRVIATETTVFDFGQWLGLTETEALEVSDHYPVEMVLSY